MGHGAATQPQVPADDLGDPERSAGRRSVLSGRDPPTVARLATAAGSDRPGSPARAGEPDPALAENIRRASQLFGAKETPAIVSNAGNGPVQHIDRRKKTAAARDTFDESFATDRRRVRVELHRLQDRPAVTLFLQASTGEPGAGTGLIILKDLNFSTQSANDYRPADKNQNQSLRDVLDKHDPAQLRKLKLGAHPLGRAIDPDSLVLSTAEPLEITIPTKAFGNRQDISFFLDATLDRDPSPRGIVRLVASSDRPTAPGDFADLLVDPDSPLAASFRESGAAFCRTFPNRFVYVDDTRGLSAGFHLIEGLFRDDQPLCKLVLSDEQNRELNRLWEELYFVTGMLEKMLRGFVFFERSERNFLKHPDFDPFKEEDPELAATRRSSGLNRFISAVRA